MASASSSTGSGWYKRFHLAFDLVAVAACIIGAVWIALGHEDRMDAIWPAFGAVMLLGKLSD